MSSINVDPDRLHPPKRLMEKLSDSSVSELNEQVPGIVIENGSHHESTTEGS